VLDDSDVFREPGRRYDPLVETGLYRDFGLLKEESRDDVLAFANKQGLLGVGRPIYAQREWGEPFDFWAEQVRAMRSAVALWDALGKRDLGQIEALLEMNETTGDALLCCFRDPDVRKTRRQIIVDGVIGEVFTPAAKFLNEWVNEHIKGHVSPHLGYVAKDDKSMIQVKPHNLLGCLWLQLALAIAGQKENRVCKVCSRWFEVSEDERTARRVFCSQKCKSTDYRKTKEKAVNLFNDGMAAKEIARQLGKEVDVVSGWLPARRKKK
jgi:hypothetical protein